MRVAILATFAAFVLAAPARAGSPVGPSPVVAGISWNQSGVTFGSSGDIWPVTMRPDGQVETAWGDAALGCTTKVSYGTAHLPSTPGATLTGDGCGPPGSGNGKITSLLFVGSTLWAILLTKENSWPDSPLSLMSSHKNGAHWTYLGWSFPAAMKPTAFVQDGPADGNVYLLAQKPVASATALYLMRVPANSLSSQTAYRYFSGTAAVPAWSTDPSLAKPIVSGSPWGFDYPAMGRIRGINRYFLSAGLGSPDSSAVLDAPAPWGPWTTVEWREPGSGWMSLRTVGERQTLGFPYGWQASTGTTLWAVWGCYGSGCGAAHHDRGSINSATLVLR